MLCLKIMESIPKGDFKLNWNGITMASLQITFGCRVVIWPDKDQVLQVETPVWRSKKEKRKREWQTWGQALAHQNQKFVGHLTDDWLLFEGLPWSVSVHPFAQEVQILIPRWDFKSLFNFFPFCGSVLNLMETGGKMSTRVVTKISSCRVFVVSSRGSRKQSWRPLPPLPTRSFWSATSTVSQNALPPQKSNFHQEYSYH